jgi:hypothetical protein
MPDPRCRLRLHYNGWSIWELSPAGQMDEQMDRYIAYPPGNPGPSEWNFPTYEDNDLDTLMQKIKTHK